MPARDTLVSGSNRDRSISGKIFECGSVRPRRLLSFCKMNEASSSVVPATTSFAVGRGVCSSALEPTAPEGLARTAMGTKNIVSGDATPAKSAIDSLDLHRLSAQLRCGNTVTNAAGHQLFQDARATHFAVLQPIGIDPLVCTQPHASGSAPSQLIVMGQSAAVSGSSKNQKSTADCPADPIQSADGTSSRRDCRYPKRLNPSAEQFWRRVTHGANGSDTFFVLCHPTRNAKIDKHHRPLLPSIIRLAGLRSR